MSASSMPPAARILLAQAAMLKAAKDLGAALLDLCPDHKPEQHRDGKQPWCGVCGRDAAGLIVRDES